MTVSHIALDCTTYHATPGAVGCYEYSAPTLKALARVAGLCSRAMFVVDEAAVAEADSATTDEHGTTKKKNKIAWSSVFSDASNAAARWQAMQTRQVILFIIFCSYFEKI